MRLERNHTIVPKSRCLTHRVVLASQQGLTCALPSKGGGAFVFVLCGGSVNGSNHTMNAATVGLSPAAMPVRMREGMEESVRDADQVARMLTRFRRSALMP